MQWRVSLSYLEQQKKRDTLYVDVIITPVGRTKKADPQLQRRLEGILDRAFLRHEAYREDARALEQKAARTKSAAWRSRWLAEAVALRRRGIDTERRAAQEVRRLEREEGIRYGADLEPSMADIRQAYTQALRSGKQPPGYKIDVVIWWHERGSGKVGRRTGTVEDLPSMFGPLSSPDARLVIGKENTDE